MPKEPFTYQQEKEGLVAEYITTNPIHKRRNYPFHLEILTGADIPIEQVVVEDETDSL